MEKQALTTRMGKMRQIRESYRKIEEVLKSSGHLMVSREWPTGNWNMQG